MEDGGTGRRRAGTDEGETKMGRLEIRDFRPSPSPTPVRTLRVWESVNRFFHPLLYLVRFASPPPLSLSSAATFSAFILISLTPFHLLSSPISSLPIFSLIFLQRKKGIQCNSHLGFCVLSFFFHFSRLSLQDSTPPFPPYDYVCVCNSLQNFFSHPGPDTSTHPLPEEATKKGMVEEWTRVEPAAVLGRGMWMGQSEALGIMTCGSDPIERVK